MPKTETGVNDKSSKAVFDAGMQVTFRLNNSHTFNALTENISKHDDTMLGRMLSSSYHLDEKHEYTIEYNVRPVIFQSILGYYDNGKVVCPSNVDLDDLLTACEYFLIPIDLNTIVCRDLGKLMHYFSDRGARKRFIDVYLPLYLPAVKECADLGERLCTVVVLTSEDDVHWDESDPPPFEEEEAQKKVITSTEFSRFLLYAENRRLVEEVLMERGLKKVKLGIEAFPMDKQICDPHGIPLSNPYRYEHRPYISCSWEKEDKGNRRVAFQYVRKTSSASSRRRNFQ
eukprot:Lithocolla_globosa_v1_NODE_5241_length_1276_cov_32.660115.p1 type:complete len:286 gc:universal NODE_5241_length_1276_cov_32.660115:1246-389(-)